MCCCGAATMRCCARKKRRMIFFIRQYSSPYPLSPRPLRRNNDYCWSRWISWIGRGFVVLWLSTAVDCSGREGIFIFPAKKRFVVHLPIVPWRRVMVVRSALIRVSCWISPSPFLFYISHILSGPKIGEIS